MNAEVEAGSALRQGVTAVFERMLEGVVVIDESGRILYRNPAARWLIGDESLPSALAGLAEGRATQAELASDLLVEAAVVSIDWEGRPSRLLTLRDVTERLRAQASLVVAAEQLRSANAHLQMLADVDPLTGLLNRRGLRRVLDGELLPKVRLGWDLVAIMVDCDGFKTVNDTFDHVAGDLVLKQVGERIRSAIRPGDALARVGGDEFLVLLPGARHADALRVANRIREAIARSPIPIPFRQSEVALTVSVGVAQVPRHVHETDDIVARADARLRQSKLGGKNRVTGPAISGNCEMTASV